MPVPAEAINAACAAEYQHDTDGEDRWADLGRSYRADRRMRMRRILEAAAPLLRAQGAADELERLATEWHAHATELDDKTDALDTVRNKTRVQWQRRTANCWRYRASELERRARELRETGGQAEPALVQVGWLGPYGLIPGGMDNDPAPNWQPVYVRRENT